MRLIWDKEARDFVTPADWARSHGNRKRSHAVAAPYIRPDGMSATWNPATGRTYDSRSAYYRAVKDAGCEIVGDDAPLPDAPPAFEPSGVERDIKDAIDQLTSNP